MGTWLQNWGFGAFEKWFWFHEKSLEFFYLNFYYSGYKFQDCSISFVGDDFPLFREFYFVSKFERRIFQKTLGKYSEGVRLCDFATYFDVSRMIWELFCEFFSC